MTYDQIMKDLKNKIYKPIYLLMGDESYYIDEITNYIIANVLTENEKAFNQSILYGNETDVYMVDSAARRFPMMSNYQVVVIKEAQEVKKIDELVYYAQKPLKSTILVLNFKYKALDKRKKLYKEIDNNGVIFESKKLYDNQVPEWITKYLDSRNYKIEPIAAQMLNEFLGTELAKIVNELNKLIIILPEKTLITPAIIEQNIGISKDYNNFELQNALSKKDVLKANRIVNYFEKNPKDNPLVVTISSMYSFFCKVLNYHYLADKSPKNAASVLQINPFFVKDYEQTSKKYNIKKIVEIISILREYDLKSKGVGNVSATHGDLLREMVFKILH